MSYLLHIEKAFRISEADLRIRPIFYRIRRRIETHICISFTACEIYKELERVLYKEKATTSLVKAAELTTAMYQLNIMLPESNHHKKILLKMDEIQYRLNIIIDKFF